MSTDRNLLGFRNINEKNIINGLFAFSGALPVNKGTFVKIVSGARLDDTLGIIGNAGATYDGIQSQQWGLAAKVGIAQSGDAVIGMLLYDGRDTDENGEKLQYRPRKAAEMEVFISGQAVPIATKGLFTYSGVDGSPTAGSTAYVTNSGRLSTNSAGVAVGKFYGPKDAHGAVIFQLDV